MSFNLHSSVLWRKLKLFISHLKVMSGLAPIKLKSRRRQKRLLKSFFFAHFLCEHFRVSFVILLKTSTHKRLVINYFSFESFQRMLNRIEKGSICVEIWGFSVDFSWKIRQETREERQLTSVLHEWRCGSASSQNVFTNPLTCLFCDLFPVLEHEARNEKWVVMYHRLSCRFKAFSSQHIVTQWSKKLIQDQVSIFNLISEKLASRCPWWFNGFCWDALITSCSSQSLNKSTPAVTSFSIYIVLSSSTPEKSFKANPI